MDKKYPRFRIYKSDGLWNAVVMLDPVNNAGSPRKFTYWFDARNAVLRALGQPVLYTMTLR